MSEETAVPVENPKPIKPAVRLIFLVVSALIYIGVAILAYGGFSTFFSEPALVALVVVSVILFAAAFFAGGNVSSGVREDRGNRWVLTVFGVLGLLLAWVPAYADPRGIWTIDGETIRWIGVVLYTVGGAFRLWPVFVLGRRFSGLVAIQPGHKLVTTGVYRLIRHPSYLGLILNSLGWALAFRSGVGVLLTVLILIPLIARIHAEERLLRSQFGEEYEAFCAHTSRLIPGVY
ncbi:MAG TPA: isoprenylcysteine carboxylmethyltransferase family protein [Chthoniobacter sp.]|jgi:protein-S-isoprenylcysteine O-methyltransferase Ste14